MSSCGAQIKHISYLNILKASRIQLLCPFLASGKWMGSAWKAIYHLPPLSVSLPLSLSVHTSVSQPQLVLSHSPQSPKWAVSSPPFSSDVLVLCPDILRPQTRFSLLCCSQTSVWCSGRLKSDLRGTSCYWPPAVLQTTITASGRQMWTETERDREALALPVKQTGAVRKSSVWHEN